MQNLRDNTHYDVYENCLIFKTPYPHVHLRPKIFHPSESNSKRTPHPPLSNKLWNNNRTEHVNEQNQNKDWSM